MCLLLRLRKKALSVQYGIMTYCVLWHVWTWKGGGKMVKYERLCGIRNYWRREVAKNDMAEIKKLAAVVGLAVTATLGCVGVLIAWFWG